MGKRKQMDDGSFRRDHQNDAQNSRSTLFVTNLPYSFSSSDLEATFSDVGPLRRCFMVTRKGSNESKGFGFVRFAASEDAARALQLKNGIAIGGRKIRVELAMYRSSSRKRKDYKDSDDSLVPLEEKDQISKELDRKSKEMKSNSMPSRNGSEKQRCLIADSSILHDIKREDNMPRGKDVLWSHASVNKEGKLICNFCSEQYAGKTTRFKYHSCGIQCHDVAPCCNVPQNINQMAIEACKSLDERLMGETQSGTGPCTNVGSSNSVSNLFCARSFGEGQGKNQTISGMLKKQGSC